jgi:hypothetical protein
MQNGPIPLDTDQWAQVKDLLTRVETQKANDFSKGLVQVKNQENMIQVESSGDLDKL